MISFLAEKNRIIKYLSIKSHYRLLFFFFLNVGVWIFMNTHNTPNLSLSKIYSINMNWYIVYARYCPVATVSIKTS